MILWATCHVCKKYITFPNLKDSRAQGVKNLLAVRQGWWVYPHYVVQHPYQTLFESQLNKISCVFVSMNALKEFYACAEHNMSGMRNYFITCRIDEK